MALEEVEADTDVEAEAEEETAAELEEAATELGEDEVGWLETMVLELTE